MKLALVEKLLKDFPELYSGTGLDIEHADGWEPVIRELSAVLVLISRKFVVDIKVSRVKEKFGMLRFSYAVDRSVPLDDEEEESDRVAERELTITRGIVAAVVARAEASTAHICEVCGQPGKRRSGGWISSLCDVHAAL